MRKTLQVYMKMIDEEGIKALTDSDVSAALAQVKVYEGKLKEVHTLLKSSAIDRLKDGSELENVSLVNRINKELTKSTEFMIEYKNDEDFDIFKPRTLKSVSDLEGYYGTKVLKEFGLVESPTTTIQVRKAK